MEEKKDIIFCQGDKKELEEITGEVYEYLEIEEIKSAFPEYKPTDYSRNTFLTFIEVFHRGLSSRILKREIYKEALKLNADALIHYTESIFGKDAGNCGDYIIKYSSARGTPVRKKRAD